MTTTASLHLQINQAVAAHGKWKSRLLQAIERGGSEFSIDKVRQDNLCEFGLWLYNSAASTAKDSPCYEKVRALHAAFHQEAAAVLALALAGKRAEAEKAMNGTYAQRSQELVRAMQEWKRC